MKILKKILSVITVASTHSGGGSDIKLTINSAIQTIKKQNKRWSCLSQTAEKGCSWDLRILGTPFFLWLVERPLVRRSHHAYKWWGEGELLGYYPWTLSTPVGPDGSQKLLHLRQDSRIQWGCKSLWTRLLQGGRKLRKRLRGSPPRLLQAVVTSPNWVRLGADEWARQQKPSWKKYPWGLASPGVFFL